MFSPKEIFNFMRSFQKCLLGKITPNLRTVSAIFQNETSFELIFYYDKPLSDDEIRLPPLAFKEVFSDFPTPDYNASFVVKIYPYPNKIPEEGFWLYERFEGDV